MDRGELVTADGSTLVGKFRNGQLTQKGTFTPLDSDVMFEGQVESGRVPAKNTFLKGVPLPISRPSFPMNIGAGTQTGSSSTTRLSKK